MDMVYDAVIVGGGPGGYSAALYCARAGLKTLVLEMLSRGGQMATAPRIDNYPGFDEGINGCELSAKMQNGAARFGAETILAQATSIDLTSQPKMISTSSGHFEAKTVILAMGAAPRRLGLTEEVELVGRGVSYCATCDGRLFSGKTTAVIGGGNSAVSAALTLARFCAKVYLIHRRSRLRASGSSMAQLRNTRNIQCVWNTQVEKILHERAVTGLSLRNTVDGTSSVLPCDGVFIAIGRIPNTALIAGQLELDAAGYIPADETTRTPLPGVFAVGDLRIKPLRQIVTAVSDGAVASKFAEEYLSALA